ncbi:hypothetical protein [Geothrix alkalitolerans]|uniref:hypothetical protein n=1 Tax=Geothrix alkalitolerans TaxID=2922724 RepID=UPI001FAEB941|nr:hypothetical protein [Geothrix alkalitolerans]
MNHLPVLFPAVLMAFSSHSMANPIDQELEATLIKFEQAYLSRNLGAFSNPGNKPFKVTIEHSLIESPEGVQSRRFTSFSDFESWLRSKEYGGHEPGEDLLPLREARSRSLIRSGIIEYDNQGISHNTLYLSRIRFTQTGRTISIVEVVLYDGD